MIGLRRHLVTRVRLIAVLLVIIALCLIGRLYLIQVHAHQHYVDKAERQYVHTVRDLYTRGSIFFTSKDNTLLSAASVKQGYLLTLNPSQIKAPDAVCLALAIHLPLLALEDCLKKATLPGRTYIELLDRVDEPTGEAIKAAALPGVALYPSQWRYYPGGRLSARTLGFVGYTEATGSELHGKYGLERQYDSVLFRPRESKDVHLFAELFANFGTVGESQSLKDPGDIILTVEPTVANLLDGVVQKTHETYQSELTGAIIMDPHTGAVYALSVVPSYDLNNRVEATVKDFKNPLVEEVFEFGSTIKALTVAAGLDSGHITRTSTYYDAGCVELNTETFCNFDGRGRGTVDMQTVLNQSLNTGVAHIVAVMGKDRFRDYFLNFKLDSETGIDLPNEAAGLLHNLESPRDLEYATASYGQGIAMTPMAVTRALAALGNGGHLVTPHLVRAIQLPDGTVKDVRYPRGAQVLKPETSEEISRFLATVVDEALLNGSVAQPNHTIAAKTGTAQMVADAKTGKYSETDYLHSFFGYFPAYDPQFLVFMYTVKPQGVRFASETLTVPFMDVAKFLINYYSIPPDR
jgi:cell division protein FtsI/penicillin-binding protein 2